MTLPVDPSWGFSARKLPDGRGERYELPSGDVINFWVTGEHSGGGLTLFEFIQQPDHPGVPLHLHHTHDEAWHILDGVLHLRIDDEVVEAEPGSTWFVPRGIKHAFWTVGRPSRFVSVFTPAGFEGWFRERMELWNSGRATPELMAELARRYDQELLEDLPTTMANAAGGAPDAKDA